MPCWGWGSPAPSSRRCLQAPLPTRAQETRDVQQTFTPTRRGGGGTVRLLYWQAPVILPPHFTAGTKDAEASRVVYEPLFSVNKC
jgi:hypothetical protein